VRPYREGTSYLESSFHHRKQKKRGCRSGRGGRKGGKHPRGERRRGDKTFLTNQAKRWLRTSLPRMWGKLHAWETPGSVIVHSFFSQRRAMREGRKAHRSRFTKKRSKRAEKQGERSQSDFPRKNGGRKNAIAPVFCRVARRPINEGGEKK